MRLNRTAQLLKEMSSQITGDQDLSGPHHVGAEIDLEFQAGFSAAWNFYSQALFFGGIAAGGYAVWADSRVGAFLAGAGLLGSVLAAAMSKCVASRALTETHPALRPAVGKTGGWQPIGTEPGTLTLPDGKVVHIKPTIGAASDEICFTRYSRTKPEEQL